MLHSCLETYYNIQAFVHFVYVDTRVFATTQKQIWGGYINHSVQLYCNLVSVSDTDIVLNSTFCQSILTGLEYRRIITLSRGALTFPSALVSYIYIYRRYGK